VLHFASIANCTADLPRTRHHPEEGRLAVTFTNEEDFVTLQEQGVDQI
jgi:hypothetical protein